MLCPSCSTCMRYDFRCDWYVCVLCSRPIGAEVLARRAKTRIGRLWLWCHDVKVLTVAVPPP